jgi:hypothetical protein
MFKQIIASALGLSLMTGVAATSFAGTSSTAVKADSAATLKVDVAKPTPDCVPGLVIAVLAVVADHYFPNFRPAPKQAPGGVASHVSEATFDK